jgi:hypothetical protein
MLTAKRVLALALMFVVFAAVYASAQQAPTPAVKEIQSLAGKWAGWGTPASGSAFPIEVQINPDGTYTSLMGASRGTGTIKVDGGKITTEGHLSGPAGVAAGAGTSQANVTTKGGKQVLVGQGRNDAGPFNYELTKE